jgi:hypothetical protein
MNMKTGEGCKTAKRNTFRNHFAKSCHDSTEKIYIYDMSSTMTREKKEISPRYKDDIFYKSAFISGSEFFAFRT